MGIPKSEAITTQKRIDVKRYNEVVAKANLRDLQLVSSRSILKPDLLSVDRSQLQFRIGDELAEFSVDNDAGTLACQITFKVECVEGRRKPFIVEGDYLIRYEVDGEVDESSAELFLKRVARFACYPYFRALFTTLIGQANLMLPPLPVLKEPARKVVPTANDEQGPAGSKRKARVKKASARAG